MSKDQAATSGDDATPAPEDDEAAAEAEFAEGFGEEEDKPDGSDKDQEKADADDDKPAPDENTPADDAAADAPDDDSGEDDEDTSASDEASDDLWKDITPAQRDALEALQSQADKSEKERMAAIGRIAPLQRTTAQLEEQIEELKRTKAKGTDQSDKGSSLLDTDAMEEARKKYPEIAKPFVDAISGLEEKIEKLSGSVEAPAKTKKTVTDEDISDTATKQWEHLNSKHADFQEIFKDPEFGKWVVEDEPPVTHRFLKSQENELTDALSVVDVLDRWKAHKAAQAPDTEDPPQDKIDAKRAKQADAAAEDKVRNPAPETDDEDDFAKGFNEGL